MMFKKGNFSEFHRGARRFAYIAAWVVGIILFGLCSFALFLLVKPYDEITPGAVEVISDEPITPGSTVILRTSGFCNVGVDITVEREIFTSGPLGSGGAVLPTLFFDAPKEPSCIPSNDATLKIPEEIPPGEWQIRVITSYTPNPIRSDIELEKTSNVFTIVAGE